MIAIQTREKIKDVQMTIRDIEKKLHDRRIKPNKNNGENDRRITLRRQDTITSKIFDNTIQYHTKNSFSSKTTEKFVDDTRSGFYG